MPSGKITDHLANERTFLAWVRTSVALLGFGVVIAKLTFIMDAMRSTPAGHGLPAEGHGGRTLFLGLLFCLVGLLTLIFAAIHYLSAKKTIESESYVPPGSTIVALAVIVSVLALASIALLLQMGS